MGRIFSVVGRNKTVMICDSTTNKGSYSVHESTLMGELYAVRAILKNIHATPRHEREDKYAILVPKNLQGLASSSACNYWLQHRKSKSGTKLSMEYIGLVADIVGYVNEIGNVKILSGHLMYRGIYAMEFNKAWRTLDKVEPRNNYSVDMVN